MKDFSNHHRDVAERFDRKRKSIGQAIEHQQKATANRFSLHENNEYVNEKKIQRRIKNIIQKTACASLLQPKIKEDTNLADFIYIGKCNASTSLLAIDASITAYNMEFDGVWLYRDYLHGVSHVEGWRSQIHQYSERVSAWEYKNAEAARHYEHSRDTALTRASASENSVYIEPLMPDAPPRPVLQLSDDQVTFVHQFNRNKHAPDRHGFLHYLQHNAYDFYKNIIRTQPFYLKEEDRIMHTYIVGGSGSGKSELLKGMIHDYVINKASAVVVLDPNGDFSGQIARWGELANSDDLVYLDYKLKANHTFTINPFIISGLSPSDRSAEALQTRIVVANQLQDAFVQIVSGDSGGDEFSINMKALLMPCLVTLLEYENATILDLQRFMNDGLNKDLIAFAKTLTHHPNNVIFFESEFMDKSYSPTKKAVAKKIRSLLNFPPFFHLTCGKNTVDLERLINERKTIIFNLSKGAIGSAVMGAFGRLVVSMIQGIAMRRESIPRNQRVPCHLFLDECHNFISPSIEEILVESRKYALHLTMAQQAVGYKMNTQLRNILKINTVVKISGKMPNTAWQDTASYLGVPVDMFSELMRAKGRFISSSAGSPPVVISGRTDLLDERNSVDASEWSTALSKQSSLFYRSYLDDEIVPQQDDEVDAPDLADDYDFEVS